MKNIRFYKTVIIILVLLNIGSLTFLWLGRPRIDHSRQRGQAAEFLIRELSLTPGQQDEFGKLREMHSEKLLILQEQDRKLHNRFFESIFLQPADTIVEKILIDSLADLRKQMEILTFEHFRELRQLLTGEQKIKFHQVFREALNRAMPLPNPPPPPLPPPPPPPLEKH